MNGVQSPECDAHPGTVREQELFNKLNVCETNLSSEEAKQLRSHVLKDNDALQLRKMN